LRIVFVPVIPACRLGRWGTASDDRRAMVAALTWPPLRYRYRLRPRRG
jgi:hypothetical protein